MIKCTACGDTAVANTALHKEFYYCRTCKEEVKYLGSNLTMNMIQKTLYPSKMVTGEFGIRGLSIKDFHEYHEKHLDILQTVLKWYQEPRSIKR